MEDFLTVAEVCALLNKPRSTVTYWCNMGIFPNAKLYGRMWLIPSADLPGFDKRIPKPGRKKQNQGDADV